MTTRLERSEPGATTDRSPSDPYGTWTIDPATSTVCFAWRALGLWTVTGRRQCLGAIHLDDLPPAGVIRFEQPSNLPVLTMATLTTHRTPRLVELRLEADPKASGRDRLVLRGRSVLDRRAFAAGNRYALRTRRRSGRRHRHGPDSSSLLRARATPAMTLAGVGRAGQNGRHDRGGEASAKLAALG